MFVHTIIGVLEIILNAASFLILIQAVLSILLAFNIVNRYGGFVAGMASSLDQITAPMYRPIRRVVPASGGVDWSPFVALIVIRILMYVLGNIDMSVLSAGIGG
ncbi:YggT family protein [Sphingomonas bacterium]|uniref:YggT family protein n=1 Tax=Sphingomonas bacterium TaxID=1895847 RepID=UPI0015770DCD|nr:YggT family protein [Sphingomonas bacterium]